MKFIHENLELRSPIKIECKADKSMISKYAFDIIKDKGISSSTIEFDIDLNIQRIFDDDKAWVTIEPDEPFKLSDPVRLKINVPKTELYK